MLTFLFFARTLWLCAIFAQAHPEVCSSRDVVSPPFFHVIPIILLSMFLKNLSLKVAMLRALNSLQMLIWMKQKMSFGLNSCGNNLGLYFHARLHLSQSVRSLIHLVCWFSFILLPSTRTLILNKSPHLPRLLGYSNHVVSSFSSPSRCCGVSCFVSAELAQPLICCLKVPWLNVLRCNLLTTGAHFYGQHRGISLAPCWCGLFHSSLQLEKGHQGFLDLQELDPH